MFQNFPMNKTESAPQNPESKDAEGFTKNLKKKGKLAGIRERGPKKTTDKQ